MSDIQLLGGRYEVGDVIGRGGMATVRRARDTRLGRDVAIKQLRIDLASDPTFQERFRREAQASAGLNHPNIVAVYDTGEQADPASGVSVPYIVMELIQGKTLRDLLRDGRPIVPEKAMEFELGVLDALAYSHASGIIHRDIKPANVMITASGLVKVMDFGIARAVSDTSSTMTQTAAVIGTAQYLSPEQARGETVDARSDIYSAGCLLYELLVGKPPFTGDSPVSVAYQHVREEPVPPGQLDSEVTPPMDAIVLTALAKQPQDRYQTAGAMAADIRRLLAGQPIEAAAPVPVPVPQAVGASAAPSAPTAVLSNFTGSEDEDAADAASTKRRGRWLWPVITGLLLIALVGIGLVALNRANSVSVPSVKGLDQATAMDKIRQANLNPVVVPQAGPSDGTVGTVTSQNPVAGLIVAPASAVSITVNTGPEVKTLPSGIVGNDVQKVIDSLEAEGFTNVKAQKADTEPAAAKANQVLEVDPIEGSQVALGQTITLYYATGKVTVQNYRTLRCEDAEADAEKKGLKVMVTDRTSDTMTVGTVVDTRPIPGSVMNKTDTLTIYCAVKPTPVITTTSTTVVTPPPSSASPSRTPSPTP